MNKESYNHFREEVKKEIYEGGLALNLFYKVEQDSKLLEKIKRDVEKIIIDSLKVENPRRISSLKKSLVVFYGSYIGFESYDDSTFWEHFEEKMQGAFCEFESKSLFQKRVNDLFYWDKRKRKERRINFPLMHSFVVKDELFNLFFWIDNIELALISWTFL